MLEPESTAVPAPSLVKLLLPETLPAKVTAVDVAVPKDKFIPLFTLMRLFATPLKSPMTKVELAVA